MFPSIVETEIAANTASDLIEAISIAGVDLVQKFTATVETGFVRERFQIVVGNDAVRFLCR